jgi:hypothetical protein
MGASVESSSVVVRYDLGGTKNVEEVHALDAERHGMRKGVV